MKVHWFKKWVKEHGKSTLLTECDLVMVYELRPAVRMRNFRDVTCSECMKSAAYRNAVLDASLKD